MLDDQDKRVVPAVLDSLTKLKMPGLDDVLLSQLKAADIEIRAAAARNIGVARSAAGVAALRDAYRSWQADQGSG